jgi:Putative Flp pilus-assembly TadE/G-like
MRVRTREERGQAFALMVVALVALLGTSALVMDVGFAWYAKRQVQASADAAALAGAQQLPDVTSATNTANQYASLNTPDNLSNVSVNVTTRCSVTATANNWCGPGTSYAANTIAVTETANSPTWFAKIFGINNFGVKGVATACQPCSSSPVDIMLVIDRTGSMCQPTGPSGECTDLDNAKDGVQTLLGIMDPNIDTVGLVAFPPYNNNVTNAVCDNNSVSNPVVINGTTVNSPGSYDQQNLVYLDDTLKSDFKTSATATMLNPASNLVKHMTDDSGSTHNCIQSFGSTSYDEALKAGQAELVKDGRPGVPKVIVFMTDGEANQGSYWAGDPTHGLEPDLDNPKTNFNMASGGASTINPGDAQPCHAAINVATAIKAAGTTVYSIGYDLFDQTTGYAYCVHSVWGQIDKSMASSNTDYADFECTAIGSPLLNTQTKPALPSWATTLTSGHYQGVYPVPSPSKNATNPCTNTITGDHREVPNITSYQTLVSIASPGDFYNKPTAGDMTQIFAAIAADITKGTSRLVDDSY